MPENPNAFPSEHHTGMTLRDYFAAAALTGILYDSNNFWEIDVEQAFKVADMMLARRETPQTT